MSTQHESGTEKPWHADFPTPQSKPNSISREELLQLLKDGNEVPGRDFLPIDVRRTDFEGGTIGGSLNLPAQSLWYMLDTLYELCDKAGVSLVVFYCGSSNGRGPRAAGWFQDHLNKRGNTSIRSVILKGGIKGWFSAGDQYLKFVRGHPEA